MRTRREKSALETCADAIRSYSIMVWKLYYKFSKFLSFQYTMRNSRTNAQLTSDQSIWPLASNQINQRQFNSWCCIYSLSVQSLATPVSLARTLLCFYFFLVLLFKSNFRTAYGIWIVVLWLCLKQFICSIVYVWYTQSQRPAHCCSCHLKYDEKRRKKRTHTVGTFVIYTQ